MLILVEAFTRNLVFFGVADALLAILGLYGFTRLISWNASKRDRFWGTLIMAGVIVILIIVNILAYQYTHK